MEWILAIGSVLGLGGTAFFAFLVWRLSRELTSVNGELVIEKSTNAALAIANKSLRETAGREKAARLLEPVPVPEDSASTEEALETMRRALRSLATGRMPSVSPDGETANDHDLPGGGAVHGTAPSENHDAGDEHGNASPNPQN